MRKLIAIAVTLFALGCVAARAGTLLLLGAGVGAPGPAAYSGPGDVQSGALFWYSCSRAYNLAWATGHGNLCTLRRASDAATCTYTAASDGSADLTVATPCTGSTTVTAFCNATTCTVAGVFDQSGALGCTGSAACDLPAPTAARQPAFTFSCVNSHPCINPNNETSGGLQSTSTLATRAQSFTFIYAAERTGAFTTTQVIFTTGSTTTAAVSYRNSTNTAGMSSGSTATWTASDSAFHALAAVFAGASSIGYTDGTATSGLSAGTNSAGGNANLTLGNASTLANPMTGYIGEVGLWPGTLNSTQVKAQCTNQRVWWGTGGAC